jgi:hypothetical protein
MDDRPRSTQRSAACAKSLLDTLLIEAPFQIRGIQVDGGAEFKSVFGAVCQARPRASSWCCRKSGPNGGRTCLTGLVIRVLCRHSQTLRRGEAKLCQMSASRIGRHGALPNQPFPPAVYHQRLLLFCTAEGCGTLEIMRQPGCRRQLSGDGRKRFPNSRPWLAHAIQCLRFVRES